MIIYKWFRCCEIAGWIGSSVRERQQRSSLEKWKLESRKWETAHPKRLYGSRDGDPRGYGRRVPVPKTRLRFAATANARKSRSRVMREMPWSIQLWAIRASPRRALRRFASTFARNAPNSQVRPRSEVVLKLFWQPRKEGSGHLEAP